MIRSLKKSLFLMVSKQEKKSFFLTYLLFLPSVIFECVVLIRNILYDKEWLKAKRAKKPVISVGNIIAGGAGKTPIVLALSKQLNENKIFVGIASRGYLSKAEKSSLIGSIGKGPIYDANVLGDEPYLLAKRCPEIFLGVGKKRLFSCNKLIELGADVIILDDGMQHRKLYRDIEIVVLHGERLFGNNKFIPYGFLRDDPKRLKNADLIVVNHTNDFTRIKDCVKVHSESPICFVRPKISGIFSFDNAHQFFLEDAMIGVFCAIGDPKPFLRLLNDVGATIVKTLFGFDHQKITSESLQKFAKKCKRAGAQLIVCTEKDQVKFLKSFQTCLPVAYVEIEIDFLQGKENWDKLMDRAVGIIKSNKTDGSMQKKECV